MHASSSFKTKTQEEDLSPPKQTEWRKYSKTLIEELKEKLKDRRLKTLALLTENKDLSAFQEVDTESDGLDDTSTNVTSKDEKLLEHGIEQMQVISSMSEASSLTDTDCCPDPDLEHRFCSYSPTMVGCDGLCSYSSYSTTSSIITDDECATALIPPLQDSQHTISPGYASADQKLGLVQSSTLLEVDSTILFKCANPQNDDRFNTSYTVRKSSSHCCLAASSSPLAAGSVSVRMTRSHTDLLHNNDVQFELTSFQLLSFSGPTSVENKESFDQLKSSVVDYGMSSSTALVTLLDNEVHIVNENLDDDINYILSDFPVKYNLVNNEVAEENRSLNMILEENNEIKESLLETVNEELNDHIKELSTNELCNLQIKKDVWVENKESEYINKEHNLELFSNQDYDPGDFDIESPENEDFLQWKLVLQKIYDVINLNIAKDIDQRLVSELKARMNMARLNVSGNSGYQTHENTKHSDQTGDHNYIVTSMSSASSQQLKDCLEKVKLASTLKQKMIQARIGVTSLAAKWAYDKAIGDFNRVMNDFFVSHMPEKPIKPENEQCGTDMNNSIKRSETFVISKEPPSELSPTFTIFDMATIQDVNELLAKPSEDVSASISADFTSHTKIGYRSFCDNVLPPKSSPTYIVTQKCHKAKITKRRKQTSTKQDKIPQHLLVTLSYDSSRFAKKHFNSKDSADSNSDSSDSLFDLPDHKSCKYTSSMLAQLLDYDSQDEKQGEQLHDPSIKLKDSHSIFAGKNDECFKKDNLNVHDLKNFGLIPKEYVTGNYDDKEDIFTSSVEINQENIDYDSDFNPASISECIQEDEDKTHNSDHKLPCFKSSYHKEADVKTLNIYPVADSEKLTENKLRLNEDISTQSSHNFYTSLHDSSKADDIKIINKDLILISNSMESITAINVEQNDSTSISNILNSKLINYPFEQENTSIDKAEQNKTNASLNENDPLEEPISSGSKEIIVPYHRSRKMMKDSNQTESNRPPFIPKVEWSSSEEDLFDDLSRDKSPSDLLRKKQKDMVDEKLKQLSQISNRTRKSRSPLFYKLPESVSLKLLLEDALRDEKVKDNQFTEFVTSNLVDKKNHLAVLKSPLSAHRQNNEHVHPSVSDLLLSRLGNEEPIIELAIDNKTSDRGEEESVGDVTKTYEISRPSSFKIFSNTLKSADSPHKLSSVSMFTSQSPTKSTILTSAGYYNITTKDISSKTVSTEPMSSVSTTSGEYTFPDNVGLEQSSLDVDNNPLYDAVCKCNTFSISGLSESNNKCAVLKDGASSQLNLKDNFNVLERESPNHDNKDATIKETKSVDQRIREVQTEEQVTSQYNVVKLQTAETEGGPSMVCKMKDDKCQSFLEDMLLSELKSFLLKSGKFSNSKCFDKHVAQDKNTYMEKDNQGLNSTTDYMATNMIVKNDLDAEEYGGQHLLPTPSSAARSPQENAPRDTIISSPEDGGPNLQCEEDKRSFIEDSNSFIDNSKNKSVYKMNSEIVCKAIIADSKQMETSISTTSFSLKTLNKPENSEEGCVSLSDKHVHGKKSNEIKYGEMSPDKQEITKAKDQESNSNAAAVVVDKYINNGNDILVLLLNKVTQLEKLIGQSQPLTQTSEMHRNSRTHEYLFSLYPSVQHEIITDRSTLCPFPLHCTCHFRDLHRVGFQPHNCCDSITSYGCIPSRTCPEAASEVSMKGSRTNDSYLDTLQPTKKLRVYAQNDPRGIGSNASLIHPVQKDTRQVACQVELTREHCECLERCNKLHKKLLELLKSVKDETKSLVNSGCNELASQLRTQLADAIDHSQQSVTSLINACNQSLTQQLNDLSHIVTSLTSTSIETDDRTKGQGRKQGIDYDTLKMRVVELTSQRDAEKVFHKITRESLRALERDHDRLRQEYVRATYRRLNHNYESDVRHRVYSLLTEPDNSLRCKHHRDRRHHSRHTAKPEERKKFCQSQNVLCSVPGAYCKNHLSLDSQDMSRIHDDDQNGHLTCSDTSKTGTRQKERRGLQSVVQGEDKNEPYRRSSASRIKHEGHNELITNSSRCYIVELKRGHVKDDCLATIKDRDKIPSQTENSQGSATASHDENSLREYSVSDDRQHRVKKRGGQLKRPATNLTDKDLSPIKNVQVSRTKRQEMSEFLQHQMTKLPFDSDSKSSLSFSNDSF